MKTDKEVSQMKDTAKQNGKKKGILALLMESIAKSNDGCGPGCGCHAADETKPKADEIVGNKKK